MKLRSMIQKSHRPPSRRFLSTLLCGWVLLFLVACAHMPPIDEWNLARSAYDAAKDADAPRYTPALWFKAEQSYREAQRAYKDTDYVTAHDGFIAARQLCEQAENAARLARQQSGEVVP